MNKQTVIIVILVAIIVLAGVYFGYTQYVSNKYQKELNIAQQAGSLGYQKAILDVATLAVKCQEVPLIIGNQTINVIDVQCLQRTPAK